MGLDRVCGPTEDCWRPETTRMWGEKVQGMELMSLLRAWELLGHDSRSQRDGGEHKRYTHGKRAQGSG